MQNNFESLQKGLSSYSYDDASTAATIHRVYKTNNYILDPHGAVAFLAAEQFIQEKVQTSSPKNLDNETSNLRASNLRAIILETAHPVKFPEVVEAAIGQTIDIPASVQFLLDKEKIAIPMEASYQVFKAWMLGKVSV